MSSQLTLTYDHLMEKEKPNVWLIRGVDNIISKTMEIMNRAKQRIMLFGTLYSPREMDPLRKQISAAKMRGVGIRAITGPRVNTECGEMDIAKMLLPVTTDIIMYSRADGDAPDLEDAVAIWITGTSMASYLASNFNMMWNTSSAIDARP